MMKERKVKCPQCGRLTIYSLENKFRPFCSERCRLLDLGAWAEESYRVPTHEHVDFTHPENEEPKA
ncbi:MAG: DNA gyrase inhibitor YacG [Bdellovibrionales bacterium]